MPGLVPGRRDPDTPTVHSPVPLQVPGPMAREPLSLPLLQNGRFFMTPSSKTQDTIHVFLVCRIGLLHVLRKHAESIYRMVWHVIMGELMMDLSAERNKAEMM